MSLEYAIASCGDRDRDQLFTVCLQVSRDCSSVVESYRGMTSCCLSCEDKWNFSFYVVHRSSPV